MSRHLNTAGRIDLILKFFPRLRRKIEYIGTKYYEIQENWNYDIDYNGERWLAQTLAGQNLLRNVFDVGANLGDWAAMILETNPEAQVHCFEICPPLFKKLAGRFSGEKWKDRKIYLNSYGLSDASSEIQIKYFPDGDAGGTQFEVMEPQKAETIAAKVLRGKDYCAKAGISSIDFLKMDVEGAEHLVLRGFDEIITPLNVPVVQFEYGMGNIVTKFLLKDFYEYFENRGYKVGKLFPQSVRFREYRFQDENFLGPNYVAASPSLAGLLKVKD